MSAGPVPAAGGEIVIVASTGRCGSTLLSNLLRPHPEVLSLSELFGQLHPFPFGPRDACTGEELWAWLSAPHPLTTALVRAGAAPPELLYRAEGRRFDRARGIPAILAATLPHLSEDPDELFDRLEAVVPTWPRRSVARQLDQLFSLLAAPGQRVRVERSGSSLLFLDELVARFPDCRVVHLYRDGRDTAWSMRQHPMYRLLRDRDAGPGGDTVEWFGRFWSSMVLRGLRTLCRLPADRVLTVNYDFLAAEPEATLRVLAGFLGIAAPDDWLARGRGAVGPARRGQWQAASPDEVRRLTASCAPGQRQLRRFVRDAPAWSRPPEYVTAP